MNNLLISFSEMNISFFETFEVLNSNDLKLSNYHHKKMLREIKEVFNLFLESGDTELKTIPTICGSDICSDFKVSKFYCFIGNNSSNYCLVKIQFFNELPGAIKFCTSILRPKGIELGKLIEPFDQHTEGLPF
jgi:hypothetical protein